VSAHSLRCIAGIPCRPTLPPQRAWRWRLHVMLKSIRAVLLTRTASRLRGQEIHASATDERDAPYTCPKPQPASDGLAHRASCAHLSRIIPVSLTACVPDLALHRGDLAGSGDCVRDSPEQAAEHQLGFCVHFAVGRFTTVVTTPLIMG
jgi:hypothetical protein